MEMYNLFIALFLMTLTSSLAQQGRQIDPEIERKINEYIHNVFLPAANVTSLGLTIVQNDGETLYTNGYGWANEEKQLPNTNETLFLIASVTKSFSALVLIKTLHERFPNMGETVLDTPIRTLLPEFNFTLIDRFRSEHGTIRDLLAHRMCLPRSEFMWFADAIRSPAEVAYRQRYNEEMCGMRTEFQYQNQIYVLAGEILSHLSGKSYAETVEDFLKELGMENSHLVGETDDFGNTPQISRPYYTDVRDGLLHPVNPELIMGELSQGPAGGMLTSPNEMARYLRFHMHLGNLDGDQIVPEEVLLWMRKPTTYTPKMFNSYAYGLGLFVSEYQGWEYIHHSGGALPYESLMSFFPAQNLSIFTSSNIGPLLVNSNVLHTFIFETFNGATDAEDKARIVADEWRLREEKKKMGTEKGLEKFLEDMTFRYAGRDAEPLGEYGNGALGELEITKKENEFGQTQLYLIYGRHATGWLEPLMPGINLYVIEFDSDFMQFFYGEGKFYLAGDEEVIDIYYMQNELAAADSFGVFTAGVSLDKLPPTPWQPGSC